MAKDIYDDLLDNLHYLLEAEEDVEVPQKLILQGEALKAEKTAAGTREIAFPDFPAFRKFLDRLANTGPVAGPRFAPAMGFTTAQDKGSPHGPEPGNEAFEGGKTEEIDPVQELAGEGEVELVNRPDSNRIIFTSKRDPFKLKIGDQEIESESSKIELDLDDLFSTNQ